MTPKDYAASEAKRLLEELAPYFTKLERDAFEEMVQTTRNWDEESDRKRRCLADRITVIRDVQSQLKSIILVGAQAGRPKYVA
jgi:hypothetical protein